MSKVDDAAEIFKAWLDGRLFFEGPAGLDDDERGLIEEARGSSEPLGQFYCNRLGLSPGTTVGQAAEELLQDQRRLRSQTRLKSVMIDPKIDEAGYGQAVGRANEMLAEEIGRSSIEVEATWKLLHDKSGLPRLWLALSDDVASVAAAFDPWLIVPEAHGIRSRLNRMWGNFLQLRSHKLVSNLGVTTASSEAL